MLKSELAERFTGCKFRILSRERGVADLANFIFSAAGTSLINSLTEVILTVFEY